MATSFPNSQVSFTQLAADGTEDLEASQINTVYDEVEEIEGHLGAGETVVIAGGRWNQVSDAITSAVSNGAVLEHITSGTAAALFGVGHVDKLEDAGGTKRTVANRDVVWAEAAAANYLSMIRENATDAGVIVGYRGFWGVNNVAGTARTLIPDGTGDVTAIIQFTYVIKASDGNVDAGITFVKNNESQNIYDDGTNILTAAVSAAGAFTIQRTGGSVTFDVLVPSAGWI